jgi:hypothetical protein
MAGRSAGQNTKRSRNPKKGLNCIVAREAITNIFLIIPCVRRGGEVYEHRTALQRRPCEQLREYITIEQIVKEAIRSLKHKAIIFMNESSKINACRRLLGTLLVPHRHDVSLSKQAYCVFTSPSTSTDSTASWLSRVWTESLSKVTL